MRKSIIAIATTLLLSSCSDFETKEDKLQVLEKETISLSIPYDQNSNFGQTIHRGVASVYLEDSLISQSELIIKDSIITGKIIDIPVGSNYTFTLDIYDNNEKVIYKGTSTADIFAGEITEVAIELKAVTGSAIVIGKIIEDTPVDSTTIIHLSAKSGFNDITNKNNVVNSGVSLGEINSDKSYMLFDSTSHLEISENINFGMESFSIAFNINANIHDGAILSKYRGGVGSPEKGWNIQCENTSYDRAGVRFDMSDGYNGRTGILSTGPEVFDGSWHSVLITVDRENGTAFIYLDDVLKDSADISNIGIIDNSEKLFVGWRGDYWYHMKGMLNDVKIYSALVKSKEVNNSTGDLLSITVKDQQIIDNSPLSKQITNTAVKLSSQVELPSQFIFNNDDYIDCGNSDAFNFKNNDFSIVFSIKAPLQDGTILSKYRGGVGRPENGWSVQCENTLSRGQGVRFDISDGFNGQTGLLASGAEILDNNWHDIIISCNRTSGIATMYVDGIEKDYADISNFGNIENDANLFVGWRGDDWFHLNGSLNNIQLLNYAL